MQDNSAKISIDQDAAMEHRITRCPQCATAFRVAPQQLELANGNVRCGSCLHVFEADRHWQAPETSGTESPVLASPQPPANTAADAVEFSDAFLALDGADSAPDSLTAVAASEHAEADEEDWARQILEQEESTSRESKNELLEAIMANPAGDQDSAAVDPAAEDSHNDYEASEFQTTEGWMQELLGSEDGQTPANDVTEALPEPPELEAEPDEEYVPEIFRDKKNLLDSIHADPVEMHLRRHITPWMRHGLSLLGIVLAAALLLAQYVWFNAEHLAGDPRYRAPIARFCALTACVMPAENDISRIKNSNLVVLKHPRAEDALLLDTIITNYANYEQPFPQLHVEFTDLQDQTVAARTFSPAEYLRGDMTGRSLMPVRRPIHLSLELVDPGEQAVNYRIHLLAP